MAALSVRPHKTRGLYADWVKHVGPGAGVCFTISWGRLTQLVGPDQTALEDFTDMFGNRLKDDEFVERFEANADGITVYIGRED